MVAETTDPDLSIVVPAYCEGAHLDGSVGEILAALSGLELEWEIVIVDDGSGDCTWERILALSASNPSVRGVRLTRNFGKEGAISAGIDSARGRGVIVMDADLQHPPSAIPQMVSLWSNGNFEVVEAVKVAVAGEPFTHRLGAYVVNRLLSKAINHDFIGASDFKLLDRRVVDALKSMKERNLFFRGMVPWLGFRTARVEIEVPVRKAGRTRWSVLQLADLAVTALTAFTAFPLRLVTLVGCLFFIASTILTLQTLYMKFSGRAGEGFTTVILLTLLTASMLMMALGVIGEYVARIYEELKARPRYIVRESTLPGPAEKTAEQ